MQTKGVSKLHLKGSLGVTDHSKRFCTPKQRLRNETFYNNMIFFYNGLTFVSSLSEKSDCPRYSI